MKNSADVLAEIPCFKCLFWDWKKESHLHCNPNECQHLTDWLLEQVEKDEQNEASVTTMVATETVKS